ncbi:hypothetical protein [Brachybacterium sacelli]|uniref:hypothetical protein n=1 Tax=Brachybacterium sacelli TaxID=173364 RepID=UPI0036221A97
MIPPSAAAAAICAPVPMGSTVPIKRKPAPIWVHLFGLELPERKQSATVSSVTKTGMWSCSSPPAYRASHVTMLKVDVPVVAALSPVGSVRPAPCSSVPSGWWTKKRSLRHHRPRPTPSSPS